MAIEITKPSKNSLTVETPVMPASGTFGYGDSYQDLLKIEKLGALVTNPVTLHAWRPATGTRVVPLDAGVLVHTGLPNRGLNKTLEQYRALWENLPLPVILHLVASDVDQIRLSADIIDGEPAVDAVELGINDETTWEETRRFVQLLTSRIEKPVLVRLPISEVNELADAAVEGGAGALVVAAPPRGTARDPISKKLISGRIYGPLVKPIALRLVGQLVRRVDIPVIGCGGIHSPEDARDFMEAGARAVQVDSVTWIQPQMLELIARDLGGWVLTKPSGAFPDEWYPGMGETDRRAKAERAKKQEKDAGDHS